MERRFSGGPHMPHRVFREGGAPSHITFGSPSFPSRSSRTERRLAAEPQQPEQRNGEPQAYAAGCQLDQPAQLQLSSSWSAFPPPGQPGWWATSAAQGSIGGELQVDGPSPSSAAASPAAVLPPIEVELCASQASGLPAGMNRGRNPPALQAIKQPRRSGGSGNSSKGKLSQSEVTRLCSKLDAISDKRASQHNFVARAVHDAAPAVVRIDAQKRIAVSEATSIFDILFGAPGGTAGPRQRRKQVVTGTGSGFCIDSTGIVLTNAHVVEDADSLNIQLQSGKSYRGHVVGMHSELDLAVVKVDDVKDDRMPSVQLGSSSTLTAGDWAIALGNPLGLQHSCTLGIISSLERSTGEGGWDWMRQSLLQTDAGKSKLLSCMTSSKSTLPVYPYSL
jgi:outer membrane murein-binding lipoprotein Lpp